MSLFKNPLLFQDAVCISQINETRKNEEILKHSLVIHNVLYCGVPIVPEALTLLAKTFIIMHFYLG